jgi:hypothetical protein
MKRLLALVATAGIAVALYATTAPAGQQAVTPAQFNALKKQVTKLQKDVKTLTAIAGVTIACVFDKGAIPVTAAPQFHVTASGEPTNFWVLTTSNQDCVKLINETGSQKLKRSLKR